MKKTWKKNGGRIQNNGLKYVQTTPRRQKQENE